jgi:hypothetical protein
MRLIAGLLVAALAGAAQIAPAQIAPAQTYQPPRTADGHPDLQGVWGTGFLTGLQRPPGVKELVVSGEAAKAGAREALTHIPSVVDPDSNFITDFQLAVVRGQTRTSLLVTPDDGQLPLTPKGAEAANRGDHQSETSFDNPEERDNWERCLIGGGQAPTRPQHGYVPMRIVQTPDAIVMMTEDVGGLRVIDMAGHAPPAALTSLEGYSAGRWEGDTLVVETTHMRGSDYRGMVDTTVLAGPKARVVERFTRVSDTELVEQFTVEDPDYYARPWLAEFSMTRTDKPMYEYACHESNYALTNILRAARRGLQDKPAAAPEPVKANAPSKPASKKKP